MSGKADFSNEKDVVREADISGGRVKVFDDGSIELHTGAGTTWYRNFAELERALRPTDGAKQAIPVGSIETDGSDHGGNGPSGSLSITTEATSTATPNEHSEAH